MLIDLKSEVIMGDDCALGAGCQVWTHVGDYTYDFTDYHEKINPVYIGKGVLCWSRVIINQGVTIGEYTRIGAGSVVVKNIPEKEFWAGIPAKFIKKRDI